MQEHWLNRARRPLGHSALALALATTALVPLAHAAEGDATADGAPAEQIVVTGKQFGYNVADSALKMPISVKDTPQSVVVVTRDLMDFAGINQFSDIYKIDASAGVAFSGDQVPRNYYRGFRQQGLNAIKVDGFRMSGRFNLDLEPFERFEIVKGATSTLYGQNSVGGTLNAISKMPKSTFGGELSAEAGSFDHYRLTGDVYGPLSADGRLMYRVVGSWLDEKSYLNFAYNKHFVIAPTLRFEVDPDTAITARINYQKSIFPFYFGYEPQFLGTDADDASQIVASNFKMPSVSRKTTGAMPWNRTDRNSLIGQVMVEHNFGEAWHLRANLEYNRQKEFHNSGNVLDTDAEGYSNVTVYENDEEAQVYSAEVNLFGDVEAFGETHTLFFGADYAHIDNPNDYAWDYYDGQATGFSIYHPDYSLIPAHSTASDYPYLYRSKLNRDVAGLTAQAILHPVKGLTILAGGRYSWDRLWNQTSCCTSADAFADPTITKASKVTYQIGATYALTPSTNAYVSYGTTFEPQTGQLYSASNPNGDPLAPQSGRAKEMGFKGDLLGKKVSWSLAAFYMTRSNIAQSDLEHSGFYVLSGTQRSQGVEANLQGQVLKGWQVYGSMAYLDAKYIAGPNAGAQPVNAPRFGASLYSSYEWLDGPLKGFGMGGGVVRKSGFSKTNTYTLSDGTVKLVNFNFNQNVTEVDIRAFYGTHGWKLEAGITNLFDVTYYTQHADGGMSPYLINPPRQFKITLSRHL